MTLDELRATRREIPNHTALGTLAFEHLLQIIHQPAAAWHYDLPMGPSVIILTSRGFEYAWIGSNAFCESLGQAEEALWREYASAQL
jgi:hypothetical protein